MFIGCAFPPLIFHCQNLSGPISCPSKCHIFYTNFLWKLQFVNIVLNVDGLTPALHMVNNFSPYLGLFCCFY